MFAVLTLAPHADSSVQPLPFAQDWSNTGQITADDSWSGVAGIVGYRDDSMTGGRFVGSSGSRAKARSR